MIYDTTEDYDGSVFGIRSNSTISAIVYIRMYGCMHSYMCVCRHTLKIYYDSVYIYSIICIYTFHSLDCGHTGAHHFSRRNRPPELILFKLSTYVTGLFCQNGE